MGYRSVPKLVTLNGPYFVFGISKAFGVNARMLHVSEGSSK